MSRARVERDEPDADGAWGRRIDSPSSARRATDKQGAHIVVPMPQPGDTIAGKYSIVRRVGEGGMAFVYEAVHLRLRQRLAIKVLRPDIPQFDQLLARFEREARATALLRSANAARVVDVDQLPSGLPYMVMEYLDGCDLSAHLSARGPAPIAEGVDYVLQVTSAMQEAHDLGIIHRDLKPANLFLCPVGDRSVVKVLDFGISKMSGQGDSRITESDAYFGTPAYAAPEQLRDAASADARSDVWALGVILFELLTGRAPFEGTATAVIAKVMTDPVPWPPSIRPEIPAELARVVMRALERDPSQRFQSMRELANALTPFGPERSAATLIADVQRGRGRLGEILVADGLVSKVDMDRALADHKQSGKMLGRVLLDMGLVSHADLLTALAKQQGISDSASTPAVPGQKATANPIHASPTLPARDRLKVPMQTAAPMNPRRRGQRWLWIAVAVGIPLGVLCAVALSGLAHRTPAPAASGIPASH